MPGSNYNFTENGQVIPFEDAFIRVEQFQNQLWVWGSNNFASIPPTATSGFRSTPTQEYSSTSNWKLVSHAYLGTMGIKTDGTLWGVSRNYFGELGVNDRILRDEFIQIGNDSNWKMPSSGKFYTNAAIKTDGTLWLWGLNFYGAVGDDTTASRSTPRQEFTSGTNWKQVAVGQHHTAAIKTDGTLWAWGFNSYGQLGDNTRSSRLTPRQEFTSGTNWKQVSAGANHTAAIKTNGTLWCWGYNLYGQLGDNTNASRSTPRQEITSGTNWKQVACGDNYTAAIKTDGTLWLWGDNSYGQLGDNTTTSRSTPRQEFTSGTNWKQVFGGRNHTAAIKTDGTLWGWGRNNNGQLGDNTNITRSTPRQEFTSSTNWKQVFAGGFGSTIAVKAEDYPILY